MTQSTVKFSTEGSIGIIAIDRPEKLNALDSATMNELLDLLSDHGRWQGLTGCLLRSSSEKAFIVGADIKEQSPLDPEAARVFGQLGQAVCHAIELLPVPVIACVDGFALGGGSEVAMACDFIYATQKAVFGQPEVKLGLIPGFGGCVRLPAYVGVAKARELIFSGRHISAREAAEIGLVAKLFADGELMIRGARDFFDALAGNSPNAIRLCKRMLRRTVGSDELYAHEQDAFFEAYRHQDRTIGTKAFLDKRKPVWS